MTRKTAGPGNLPGIQMLRGIAALMVVIFHLFPPLERMGFAGQRPEYLTAGVDVFFVISGFVMWWSTEKRVLSPLRFYRSRIIRIAPLYWLITTGLILILVATPSLLPQSSFSLPYAAKSFLFLPAKAPHSDNWFPVLIPGWTLNFEMGFYAIFGLALIFKSSKGRLLAIIVPVAGIVALGPILKYPGALEFYSNSIGLEFLFGVALAKSYGSLRWPFSRLWLGAAVAGFVLLSLSGNATDMALPRAVLYGLPALLIVVGFLLGVQHPWTPLARIGDWSYSLYLIHLPIVSAIGQIWWRAGLPMVYYPPVAIAAVIGASAGCFHFIESPLTVRLNRNAKPVPQSTATSIA